MVRLPRDYKVVHVVVALCDNKNQGIVPVPAALGNGQDPANNLYWGAMYGVKTFFRKSEHWSLIAQSQPAAPILERSVFRSRAANPAVYVVADAYDGSRMDTALRDFFRFAAGQPVDPVHIRDRDYQVTIQAAGHADAVCFVGHDGLMDMKLTDWPKRTTGPAPTFAVVLACKSRDYFGKPLADLRCPAVLTTTGLMAPEAYTLDAVLRAWAKGATLEEVRAKAGHAYATYQKISVKAGERLFAVDKDY